MSSTGPDADFGGRGPSSVTIKHLSVACVFVLVLLSPGCHSADRGTSGIVLTIIDQGWPGAAPRLGPELEEFTKQTGIRVQVLPAPEAAVEQLATWRELLDSRAEEPDVYAIDIIWPRVLADGLIDLKPYVSEDEIAVHFPDLIANYTVNGKLVALPYNISEGLLFYRVDLLAKYGFGGPPRTWEELEAMARRIQTGERANGNKDFWGFVWEGAPSEALTCNALEWQVSEGGGTILDEHGNVTVNNSQTIRALSMAARWAGSISPPGVTTYQEWDAFNMWQAGNVAFMRNWTNAYVAARAENSPTRGHFDIASLPRGSSGFAATLGGNGYGVSRYSRHSHEAVMLVRFLASPEEQASRKSGEPPTIPALYKEADVLAANPYFSRSLQVREGGALRPSVPAGKMYPDVSRAYFTAVHSVLTQRQSAAQAMVDLQEQLTTMLTAQNTNADNTRPKTAVAPRR